MGQGEEEVIVNPGAAIAATQHLTEQGRGQGRSAGTIAAQVGSVIQKQWGTSKVPRFEDANGGGWLVDVSSTFNDEAMYAIVRSKGGKRMVTHIVEEEEAFKIARSSRPPDPETSDDPDSAALQQALIEMRSQRDAARTELDTLRAQITKLQPKSGDKALLMFKDGSEDKKKEALVPIGTIGSEVEQLLAQGVKPENIEVWTRRQTPKVKIELE